MRSRPSSLALVLAKRTEVGPLFVGNKGEHRREIKRKELTSDWLTGHISDHDSLIISDFRMVGAENVLTRNTKPFLLTCLADQHLHGEIEEIGVSMLHFVLGQKGVDEFPAGGLVAYTQRLVLDVRPQAFCVDLHRRLKHKGKKGNEMKEKKKTSEDTSFILF